MSILCILLEGVELKLTSRLIISVPGPRRSAVGPHKLLGRTFDEFGIAVAAEVWHLQCSPVFSMPSRMELIKKLCDRAGIVTQAK